MFVIDHVIVHELAHLIESNRTPQFWSIVRAHTVMENARAWLKEHWQVMEEEVRPYPPAHAKERFCGIIHRASPVNPHRTRL